ncbi:MAG: hypothetical protein J2P36_20605 [Ktedonobacteraceae bacterium]|nr:hypothetical protein [Ktedonobacteraceae bacterium]
MMQALKRPSLTLSTPWRLLLLSLHVATTVSVLGTDLVLLTLGIASLDGADPRTIYPAAHLASIWLVAPLAVLSLGTGLLLGWLTPWGVFRYWWVTIKLAITTILTGIVLFVLVPRLGMVAAAVMASDAEALPEGSRVPLVIAPVLASSLLLLNVVLAIYKPGRRLRRGASFPRIPPTP